jgi:TPR repeat protein
LKFCVFGLWCFGQDTPQNYKQAFQWYNKAAEQGLAQAQYNLGVVYYQGKGTLQNYKQAYIWASLAAAQSDAPKDAARLQNEAARQLTSKQLKAAQQHVAEWQKKTGETLRKP